MFDENTVAVTTGGVMPVAVHGDLHAAGGAVATSVAHAGMGNYQRIIEAAGRMPAADVVVISNEEIIRAQLQGGIDAGVTDLLAQSVAVARRGMRPEGACRNRAWLAGFAR